MNITSPHEKLKQLDDMGDAYWIRIHGWTPGQREVGQELGTYPCGDAGVVEHGPEWVCLAVLTSGVEKGAYVWVRWERIGPFQICEEGD